MSALFNVKMTKRTKLIIDRLREKYPDAECTLNFGGDPWRLLVMGILSAQCKDERVNIVCEGLFDRFPDCAAMSEADVNEVEEYIKPCGLYRTKAGNIVRASKMIMDVFGGKVPENMDDLTSLPGVGRKIGNLMLGDCFGKPGIVTDTHCIRICGRLGFYSEELKDPYKIETVLTKAIPYEERASFCHRIVDFGREICTARSPKCGECMFADICGHGKETK